LKISNPNLPQKIQDAKPRNFNNQTTTIPRDEYQMKPMLPQSKETARFANNQFLQLLLYLINVARQNVIANIIKTNNNSKIPNQTNRSRNRRLNPPIRFTSSKQSNNFKNLHPDDEESTQADIAVVQTSITKDNFDQIEKEDPFESNNISDSRKTKKMVQFLSQSENEEIPQIRSQNFH
jgi:hypothetical protein